MKLPRLGDLDPVTNRRLADAGVVLAMAAVSLGVWEAPDHPAWRWIAAVVVSTLFLLLRRQVPLLAVAGVIAVWLAVHTQDAFDDQPFQFIGLLIAAYALGAHGRGWQGPAGLLLASATFAAMNLGRGEGALAAIAGTVQFAAVYAFGVVIARGRERQHALRDRAARAERERDESAREAVADERARIARDLHDSVGHSISVMVLQAGAVRRRLDGSHPAEREALERVERAGRDAVRELRAMLGLLRSRPEELEPLPTTQRIEELADSCRAAGLHVEVVRTGEVRPLPSGVEIATFRIAQEALTNVLKHAGANHVRITLDYGRDALGLEVADDGRGANGSPPGHGLIGMRERVSVHGGRLELGTVPDGGFRVHASLPVEAGIR